MTAPTIEELPAHATASSAKAIYSVVCAIAGIGILGLPHALSDAGWSGLAILLLLGVVSAYTGIILGRCLIEDTSLQTYADLGFKAFGKPGKYAVIVAEIGTCLGSAILYLVLSGQNFAFVLNGHVPSNLGTTFWIGICAIAILPLCYLRTLGETGWIALLGTIACVAAVIVIIVETCLQISIEPEQTHNAGSFLDIIGAFASMCFAYGGHVIFPGIIRVMSKPKKFPIVTLISFGVVFVLYVPVAALGFSVFGNSAKGNILLNFSHDNVAIAVVCFALTAHVLLAYVIYMNPVFFAIERSLGLEKRAPERKPSQVSRTMSAMKSVAVAEDIAPSDSNPSSESSREEMQVRVESLESVDLTKSRDLLGTNAEYSTEKGDAISEGTPTDDDAEPVGCWAKMAYKLRNSCSSLLFRIILRTIVVGLTALVAIAIPFFSDLMSFIGGSTQAASILVFPAIIYLKLNFRKLSKFEIALNIVIAVVGAAAGAIATVFALINIIKKCSSDEYSFFTNSSLE